MLTLYLPLIFLSFPKIILIEWEKTLKRSFNISCHLPVHTVYVYAYVNWYDIYVKRVLYGHMYMCMNITRYRWQSVQFSEDRSIHQMCSILKGVLAKFLRTASLTEHIQWLLLKGVLTEAKQAQLRKFIEILDALGIIQCTLPAISIISLWCVVLLELTMCGLYISYTHVIVTFFHTLSHCMGQHENGECKSNFLIANPSRSQILTY